MRKVKTEEQKRRAAAAYHKQYHKDHPEVGRASKLKRNYDITLADYEKMFIEQGGRCAICNRHQDDLDHPLAVDHDHLSGKVRGLICAPCNHILGRCGDNVSILLAAIDYLNRGGYAYKHYQPKAVGVPGRLGSVRRTDGTPARSGGAPSDDDRASETVVSVDSDTEQADPSVDVSR